LGVLDIFERCSHNCNAPGIPWTQDPSADPWDENSEAINWTNARVGLGSWEYIPGLMAGWPQLLEVRL